MQICGILVPDWGGVLYHIDDDNLTRAFPCLFFSEIIVQPMNEQMTEVTTRYAPPELSGAIRPRRSRVSILFTCFF